MRIPLLLWPYRAALTFVVIFAASGDAYAQFDRIAKSQAKDMLRGARAAIKEDYYDPKFRGLDLDATFKIAEEKIEAATSMGQALGVIAQVVLELNDSHTRFYPPSRSVEVDYGWRMQMVGGKCLVTLVDPKSDAAKQGLKVGDEIVQVEGFKPNRADLWKINYYYNTISLRKGLNVKVLAPGATAVKELNLAAKTKTLKARLTLEDLIREIDLSSSSGGVTHRFSRVGATTVWKMPSFVIDPNQVDQIMRNRIKGSANLILDLRNNGGGYVVALERLAGYFVEKDTEIAKLVSRKPMKPQMAKTAGGEAFKGRVIVLIDSGSGSASEIFARFMQLEQRGVVIGEQSAGAVMQSRTIPMQMGADSIIPYGMSVTNADVILADGVSLERLGVLPQMVMTPTPADLAAGHDPVLAAAFQLLDQTVTPEAAGKMFPVVWEDN
ncbi:MAG: S41 family peptidase [bacterium]|nr:S41 family peptidase [bacterium]